MNNSGWMEHLQPGMKKVRTFYRFIYDHEWKPHL